MRRDIFAQGYHYNLNHVVAVPSYVLRLSVPLIRKNNNNNRTSEEGIPFEASTKILLTQE